MINYPKIYETYTAEYLNKIAARYVKFYRLSMQHKLSTTDRARYMAAVCELRKRDIDIPESNVA